MPKILIVDDEKEITQVLRFMLEDAGYAVSTAAHGEEGLEKALSETPDLIISDILMPVMDGFAFYKELRRQPTTATTPVLILTARGQMEDAFKAVGVDEFVEKPSEARELLDKVGRLLKGKPAGGPDTGKVKVLIAGRDKIAVSQMQAQLQTASCEVKTVASGPDVITETARFEPQVLVMDVLISIVESPEVVRILRLLPKFRFLKIILYNYYQVLDLGSEVMQGEVIRIDALKDKCLAAGATEYLGRYNDKYFLQQLAPFLRS